MLPSASRAGLRQVSSCPVPHGDEVLRPCRPSSRGRPGTHAGRPAGGGCAGPWGSNMRRTEEALVVPPPARRRCRTAHREFLFGHGPLVPFRPMRGQARRGPAQGPRVGSDRAFDFRLRITRQVGPFPAWPSGTHQARTPRNPSTRCSRSRLFGIARSLPAPRSSILGSARTSRSSNPGESPCSCPWRPRSRSLAGTRLWS